MRSRRPIAVLLAFTVTACTFWHRDEGLLADSLATRDRVQIWIGTTAHDVHGVVVRGDSLTAVPFWKPPDCDSCRVAFARADVDSVRAVQVSGGTVLIASVALIALVILYFTRGLASNYQ
jgi:hypothetical protein